MAGAVPPPSPAAAASRPLQPLQLQLVTLREFAPRLAVWGRGAPVWSGRTARRTQAAAAAAAAPETVQPGLGLLHSSLPVAAGAVDATEKHADWLPPFEEWYQHPELLQGWATVQARRLRLCCSIAPPCAVQAHQRAAWPALVPLQLRAWLGTAARRRAAERWRRQQPGAAPAGSRGTPSNRLLPAGERTRAFHGLGVQPAQLVPQAWQARTGAPRAVTCLLPRAAIADLVSGRLPQLLGCLPMGGRPAVLPGGLRPARGEAGCCSASPGTVRREPQHRGSTSNAV